MKTSIQTRLLTLSLLSVLVVGLATAWLTYQRTVHEVDELIDAQLAQYARIMLALAKEGDDDEIEPPHIHGHPYETRLLFQIWDREHGQNRLLLRSPEAPSAWPDSVAKDGYSDARIGLVYWRVFAASDEKGERLALVALDQNIRDELAGDIALGNLKPYLIGLPVLALLLVWGIRRGLAPLRRMETELASRSPDRLDPLPDAGAPRELHPLIKTMNRLFRRVMHTLDNERRFTSDAAHELRTPLSALKIQLQVAQRAEDGNERQDAIGKALRGADRMTHLVAQLLALARLEGAGDQVGLVPVALSDLTQEAVSDQQGMADEKGIRLEADIEPDLVPLANPDLIQILLRNLLDNALRYGQPGGRITLSLKREGHRLVLLVADDGPGISSGDRDKLGQRFHRFGPQSAEGAGLGLSIVRRIAELHQAELVFSDGLAGRGLGVSLILPEMERD